ncbi:hypothetical protein AAVH_11675 [Aphelenchoides avenae]|nr:hypothetical protein AAVH_11675 [Aphelenchus avenae]
MLNGASAGPVCRVSQILNQVSRGISNSPAALTRKDPTKQNKKDMPDVLKAKVNKAAGATPSPDQGMKKTAHKANNTYGREQPKGPMSGLEQKGREKAEEACDTKGDRPRKNKP